MDEEVIQQSEHRTLVGKALFHAGKIALNTSNAVRELSSHCAWPDEDHWRSMERLVGFLLEHGPMVFLLMSPEELRGICIADSDYAHCLDTRRSIGGEVSTLGGTIVEVSSQKQKVVSLSTTESELMSYTKVSQTARFIQIFLKELFGIQIASIVFEDNAGCIFLIKNHKTGGRVNFEWFI